MVGAGLALPWLFRRLADFTRGSSGIAPADITRFRNGLS